jgi:outer membrane biosynthesis protein TonB
LVQEAARLEAQRQDAQRKESARLEATRQEQARQEAAIQQATRKAAEQAARTADVVTPTPAEKPRRQTIIGRPDTDDRLAIFAETWSQRVQQNADFEFLDAAKSGPYTNPIVTVTLRVDGTVDSVVFKRSSGIPAIDDAIRIIIASLEPYSRIPAELALDYDVVEVTRLWSFGSGLRLTKTGR